MTYLSLLHLVPLGALGLAASSHLGGENLLIGWLKRRLAPTAPDLADKLVAAMDKMDFVAFGYLGLIGVVIAGLFALMQLEHDCDDIWVVRGRRPLWKSLFLIYPFAVVIAPVLVGITLASGALAEAQSRIWIERLTEIGSAGAWLHGWLVNLPIVFRVIPYVATWIVLSAIYYLVPSGPVRLRAALLGGVIAGILWQIAQGLYLNFQFASATFREAWGFLAQIPLLLLWMFVSWLLVFLGAEIAFVWQHRQAFMPKWPDQAIPTESQERALVAIVRAVLGSGPEFPEGITTVRLSNRLVIPWRLVVRLTDELAVIGALARKRFHRHIRYCPAPDLGEWTVGDLVSRWRKSTHSLPVGIGPLIEWPAESTIGSLIESDQTPDHPPT